MSSKDGYELLDIDEFLKKSNFLKLTDDAAFKAYFKSNKKLLISLLTNFLPLPEGSTIIEVQLLDSELSSLNVSADKKKSDKTFVLDLLVRFTRKNLLGGKQIETVNVEMQSTSDPYFIDRTLAYSCRVYSQQIKKGNVYSSLFPVYSLSFTAKNLKEFRGIKEYYHVCNICRKGSPEVIMSKGLCFIVIELGKFDKNVKQLYNTRELWCYLLKNSHKMGSLEYKSFKEKGGQMAKAVKSLWNLSQEEAEAEYQFALEKRERDRMSREQFVRKEANEKGFKKGRKEGLEKGFKEGIEKGIEKGIEEGKEKGRESVILNMLKKKMDISTIVECTGVSKEQVMQLQKSLS